MNVMEEYQKNKFWNNYIEQLNKRVIKENAQRWYVIHVEQYVKSIPDKKLKYHTAENVSQYFSSTGRNKSIRVQIAVTGFAFERTIEGIVISVTDGDTIKVKTHQNKVEKIRLAQIDTPEKNNLGGRKPNKS